LEAVKPSNDKVFALLVDNASINDTSFETINSEFVTERSRATLGSKYNHHESHNNDDSLIEGELRKIEQNLNTFTVEHFNALRAQI